VSWFFFSELDPADSAASKSTENAVNLDLCIDVKWAKDGTAMLFSADTGDGGNYWRLTKTDATRLREVLRQNRATVRGQTV
jgi:hypothetical protein